MPRCRASMIELCMIIGLSVAVFAPASSFAGSASQIAADARSSLASLYEDSESAKTLGAKAKAVLVFPKIIKAGFLVGGQYGDGALFMNGKVAGYYNSAALSYGLQAGVQWFGYAMFLMDDEAVNYLHSSEGWEIGSGPSVVVWDEGATKSLSTTTLQQDAYVFIYGQQGLMAGLGLQGTKITEIYPSD